MRGRFLLVNLIGVALIVAAWWVGIVPLLIQSDRIHFIPIIGGLTCWGLWLGWAGRGGGGAGLRDKLPVLGLIGTVLGVLLAVKSVQGADMDAARLQVFTEVGQSLVANLLGILAYAWLSLLHRVCGPRDEH